MGNPAAARPFAQTLMHGARADVDDLTSRLDDFAVADPTASSSSSGLTSVVSTGLTSVVPTELPSGVPTERTELTSEAPKIVRWKHDETYVFDASVFFTFEK